MINKLNLEIDITYTKGLVEGLFKHYLNDLKMAWTFLNKKSLQQITKKSKVCHYANVSPFFVPLQPLLSDWRQKIERNIGSEYEKQRLI